MTEVTGTKSIDRGSDTIEVPQWHCGIDTVLRCGCLPNVWADPNQCHPHPLKDVVEADPEWVRDIPIKIGLSEGCKRVVFNPITQDLTLEQKECFDLPRLAETVQSFLEAQLHYATAANLIHPVDANAGPGLAAYATSITDPGEIIEPCTALGYLGQRMNEANTLVMPAYALPYFMAQNQIFFTQDGKIMTASGQNVVTDNGITNIGPPEDPWDCESPLAFTDLQEAPPGTAWIYMTSGVWAGSSAVIPPVTVDRPSRDQIAGNYREITVEAKTMTVFNACDVKAALVNINKKVEC